MGIAEEEERFGAVGKTQHLKFSRKDTIINDLKNSTIEGLISLLLSFLSLVIAGAAVYAAYVRAGNAGYLVGVLMIASLIIAIAGIIFGILGFKNRRKIRHYMERRGLILGIVMVLLLIGLYVWGTQLYFA